MKVSKLTFYVGISSSFDLFDTAWVRPADISCRYHIGFPLIWYSIQNIEEMNILLAAYIEEMDVLKDAYIEEMDI